MQPKGHQTPFGNGKTKKLEVSAPKWANWQHTGRIKTNADSRAHIMRRALLGRPQGHRAKRRAARTAVENPLETSLRRTGLCVSSWRIAVVIKQVRIHTTKVMRLNPPNTSHTRYQRAKRKHYQGTNLRQGI